jgi:cytosine/adenosine deaminase-related metal-dependent hydrolase
MGLVSLSAKADRLLQLGLQSTVNRGFNPRQNTATLRLCYNRDRMTLSEILRFAEGAVRIRARWVLPIHLPPIENGEIVVDNGRILQVGKASGRADIDLGNTALLPGLVNVHAHIEYTALRGLVEDMAFFPWVRQLTALKAHLTFDDWVASATLGAAELLAAGITCVGDCADAGASVNALIASGMRGIVFREVFGIEATPDDPTIVRGLERKLTEMEAHILRAGAEERVGVGISPHAPYTVRASLFDPLAALARRRNLRQQVHLAESPAEKALFESGTGEFAEMFARRGIAFERRGETAIAHVAASGGLDAPTVAVHGVWATAGDIARLQEANTTISHCPRSNGKLAAGFAPLKAFLDAGLCVGIGTDSMVSGNSADMFEELRFALYTARARETDPLALTARQALKLATLGGAQVLGADDELGTLQGGKRADFTVVRLDGLHLHPAPEDNIEGALVYSARASDVLATVVGGEALYEAGRFPRLELSGLRQSVSGVRAGLRKHADSTPYRTP